MKLSQVSDKEIIKWIRAHSFSKLTFLEQCWQTSENSLYLGFYYFVQQLKQNNVDEILDCVVTRCGDLASAYCYLGDVARQIYDHFDEEHIAAGFYRKAIEFDSSHSAAYWGLSTKLRDIAAGMTSVRLDYQQAYYDQLKDKLFAWRFQYDDFSNLSHDDLRLLKEIILSGKVECTQELLVPIYFSLGEYESGVELISAIDTVSLKAIEPYFKRGFIDQHTVAAKIYDWQLKEFFTDNHALIYQRYLEEFKQDNTRTTTSALISMAFRAREYQDVINHFEQGIQDDVFLKHDKDSRLYYLLAQLQMGQAADHASLTYVNERLDSLRDDSKNLFSMLRLKQHMLDLERHLSRGKPPSHNIRFDATYQAAGKILDNSELFDHFLFESFESELKQIKQRWDSAHCRAEFEQQKQNLAENQMELDDFPQLWGLAIECQEYDYAIDSVATYHRSHQPDMTSYNILGVCYDFKGEFDTAFEYYQQALKLKQQCQQRSYIIISNYVNCVQRLPNVPLDQEEFSHLRNQFNADLISDFKWRTFTAKNSRSLYKYSPFNINTIDSLTNQYFYLAGKEQLNDPIEFPDLEGIGPDKLVDENYRICSLSNNNNSMLMWSHYAQEHRGIMVEYWFGGELPEGLGIDKVRYSDDVQRNRQKEYYTFNQYVLTKNKEWAYEDEVRLFSNLSNKFSYDCYQYPNPDYSKIHARVASITLGYKFPADKRDLIVHLIASINSKRSPHEPKVVLKEAYIVEDNNFSLKYRDLDI
ncbi:DUF2971 domain-containing protein [Vibrio tubiashii]|uniref:DUF2971 domain-containing protein n=1 Tax=Vibrio tubiashii TaxID=29498 RepID=UPI00234F8F69|nr:DUF2971 domain-containing protein [Vibrio tubiashii]WCP69700.1 DUF2971 domain-containing protein [Vibrio tubiashii]